jgi:hypothetical protein
MTPALKAMVEAMAAEFERQENEAAPQDRVVWSELADDGKTMSFGVEGGCIDLEKVARAGLEAVKPAPTEVLRAVFAPSGAPGADLAQQEAIARDWNTSIGAILGEKP